MEHKAYETVYRTSLLTLLGITRFFSKIDIDPPGKWLPIFDSMKASSEMVHCKLSELDNDVEKEFVEKEEMIEKRLGKKKFYSEDELKDLKNKKGEITI
ncbi:MAG: hypothetical protein H8Z69_01055 [Nanohaloarchaea archaeon]|nr:hypothetical protein [Candidatus Nanohaloarchaea archaeon]